MTGAPCPKYAACIDCQTPMYAPKRTGRCKDCHHEHTVEQVFGVKEEYQAALEGWS